jgi:phage terminase small subunit
MPVLSNHRHEQFAQSLAGGLTATEAYVAAGYEKSGARQNVSRLLRRPDIMARVQELQSSMAAGVIRPEIRQLDARMQALQDRFNQLSRIMG